jgi:hypothetical protein
VTMRTNSSGMRLAMMRGVGITRSMGSSGVEMIISVIVVIFSRICMCVSIACMLLGQAMSLVRVDERASLECMGSAGVSMTGLGVSMSSVLVSRCCFQVGMCSLSMTARITSGTVASMRIVTRVHSIVDGCVVNTSFCVVMGGAGAVCIRLSYMCSVAMGILKMMICGLVVGVCCISMSLRSCSMAIPSILVGVVQILSVMIILKDSVANISGVLRMHHWLDYMMLC